MNGREILEALAAEVEELREDLAREGEALRSPDAGVRTAAAARYRDLVRRLEQAADMLEIGSLAEVARHVDRNVAELRESGGAGGTVTDGEALAGLLERWPDAVVDALRAPADAAARARVAGLCADAAWPRPLGESSEALLARLEADLCGLAGQEPGPAPGADRPRASPEDVEVDFAPDISPRLVDAFLHETPQHLRDLSRCVERLRSGAGGLDDVVRAQRLAHTVKGSANITGVRGIANLTHHAEDLLEHLAERGALPGPGVGETLLRVTDCLEAMAEALAGAGPAPADALEVYGELLEWSWRVARGEIEPEPAARGVAEPEPRARGVAEPEPSARAPEAPGQPHVPDAPAAVPAVTAPEGAAPAGAGAAAPVPAPERPAEAASPAVGATAPEPAAPALRVPVARVDALLRLAGELTTSIVQLAGYQRRLLARAGALSEQNALVARRLSALQDLVELKGVPSARRSFAGLAGGSGGRDDFDPLELDEYNELHSATNALAETLTDVRELTEGLRAELLDLEDMVIQQQQSSAELNEAVLSARMVPVASVVPRLERAVRQATRLTGKPAELEISGADMMVDNLILERVVDPIIHLLRNATDHGVEPADERRAAGKPEVGRLRLDFAREGETLVVTCSDDGAGLDYPAIHRTAIERGLIPWDSDLDDAGLARLTLLPGFSTRSGATQLSGRGIGLDVVNQNVAELRGTLDIDSERGRGTRVALKVPLTLVSMHVLLVRVADRVVGVPSSSLEQLLFSDSGRLEREGEGHAFVHQEERYAVRYLAELLTLGAGDRGRLEAAPVPLLLVRADTGGVAVTVDSVVDGRYLVVKRLGRHAPRARGVIGASVLADGGVAPVLDLRELLRRPAPLPVDLERLQALSAAAARAVPSVLVVDDSLSARRTLSQVVSDAGFEPRTANDGLEAIERIEEDPPAAVILDLEMPRMNGLELAAHLRSEERTRAIPLVMVTSRSTSKHRAQARVAGIDAFVTKPYEDAELAATLRELVARRTG